MVACGLAHWRASGAHRVARVAVADTSEPSRVRFAPVNVRPGHVHRLKTIYLLVGPEPAGHTIEGAWVAMARDTRAWLAGSWRRQLPPKCRRIGLAFALGQR
jgi:hypothetical protein